MRPRGVQTLSIFMLELLRELTPLLGKILNPPLQINYDKAVVRGTAKIRQTTSAFKPQVTKRHMSSSPLSPPPTFQFSLTIFTRVRIDRCSDRF